MTNSLGFVNRHRTTVPGFAQSLRAAWWPARLESCKRDRILRGRNQECERQATDRDEPPEVEQRHSTKETEADVRIVPQRDGPDCQQNPELGWTDAAERHPEYTSDRRREEHLAGHEQIGHEQRQRDDRRHVGRRCQPPKQHRGADDVEDVIEIEAVLRALDLANTGQRAVETVAEPIDGEGKNNEPERASVPARENVAAARGNHRRHRKRGQVIRVNP